MIEPGEAGRAADDEIALAYRIEAACERFEAAWRGGGRPELETFLDGFGDHGRATLARELIAIEDYWRRRAGEGPGLDDGRAVVGPGPGPGGPAEADLGRPAHTTGPPAIPGYEVFEEIGRGGMGVVYRARQSRLGRTVAIKMILQGLRGGEEARARFLAEATAVAKLQHPNIIQIYHIDEHNGHLYFEMEYVGGGNLSGGLDGAPRSPRDAARLVETLGRAMAEAHRRGVVHRDLKPSNILMTTDGVPKVADFGLAKLLDVDSGLTRTDSILGSPSYMAPEQADGKADAIGPPADLHAIGAILYELLTGRPPFRGETVLDTLRQVKTAEPVPPGRLVPGLPRDIETIALRCLHKDPKRRYPDALDLADDLRRFLAREPIRARRVGPFERAAGWCRRQPAVAALWGLVAALLAAIGAGSVVFVVQLSRAADRSERARVLAETTLTDMFTRSGVEASGRGDPATASLWFANAALQGRGDPDRGEANRARVRAWVRGVATPVRAFRRDPSPIDAIASGQLSFSPDGRHLLAGGPGARPSVWEVSTERQLDWLDDDGPAGVVLWGPRGGWLALGLATGEVVLRGLPDGRVLDRVPSGGGGPVAAIATGPDGSLLAIATDRLRLWDARTKATRSIGPAGPGRVTGLEFSPDGTRLVAASGDGLARVFDAGGPDPPGGPAFPPVPHRPPRAPVAPRFVDGGRGFLTVTEAEALTWWDARTGARVRTIRCPVTTIDAVAISGDGRHLAVGGYGGCHVADLAAGPEAGGLLAHRNSVQAVGFSPDHRSVVTGGAGREARLWSVPDRDPAGPPIAHQGFVARVAFAPDGRSLATEQLDGLVRIWRLPPAGPPGRRLTADPGVESGRLGPDGRHLIASSDRAKDGLAGATRVFDASTGRASGSPLAFDGFLRDARLAPDGRTAATISRPDGAGTGRLQFWAVETGARLGPPIVTPSEPVHLAYSPDGLRVAVSCRGGEIPLFGTDRGGPLAMARHEPTGRVDHPTFSDLAFSPDGTSLVSLGADRSLQVADPVTGRPRYPAIRLGSAGWNVRVSPDGLRMAVGTADGRVRVWAVATGRLEAELPKHPDWVYLARFSPDGRRVATACRDGEARLWDLRTLDLACPPFKHGAEVLGVAFSPDGRHVATSSRDETIRVWEWRTGGPVMPPLPLNGLGTFTLDFNADGTRLIGAGRDPAPGLVAFDMGDLRATDAIGPDDLRALGELVSGLRVRDAGLAGLTSSEWLGRWREFHGRHPGFATDRED